MLENEKKETIKTFFVRSRSFRTVLIRDTLNSYLKVRSCLTISLQSGISKIKKKLLGVIAGFPHFSRIRRLRRRSARPGNFYDADASFVDAILLIVALSKDTPRFFSPFKSHYGNVCEPGKATPLTISLKGCSKSIRHAKEEIEWLQKSVRPFGFPQAIVIEMIRWRFRVCRDK